MSIYIGIPLVTLCYIFANVGYYAVLRTTQIVDWDTGQCALLFFFRRTFFFPLSTPPFDTHLTCFLPQETCILPAYFFTPNATR